STFRILYLLGAFPGLFCRLLLRQLPFKSLFSIWTIRATMAIPSTPCPSPKYTQLHPRSPNLTQGWQRVVTPKAQTQRKNPLRLDNLCGTVALGCALAHSTSVSQHPRKIKQ